VQPETREDVSLAFAEHSGGAALHTQISVCCAAANCRNKGIFGTKVPFGS